MHFENIQFRVRDRLAELSPQHFVAAQSTHLNSARFDRLCGSKSHRLFAPELAYGRHRGPVSNTSHPAAVLVCLVPFEGRWCVPLTLRSPKLSDHAGQVSLPGGRVNRGESAWQAAAREFEEELGISRTAIEPIGSLSPMYVYASHHYVQVCVGYLVGPALFRPQAEEVSEIILLDLKRLLDEEAQVVATMQRGTAQYDARGFRVGKHLIWGATAMVLNEFRDVLLKIAR